MGALSFTETIKGVTAKETFDRLTEDATYEHGNDGYNGTINTCSLGREKLSFKNYNKKNEEKAYKFIEENNNGQKRVADYVDLGVMHYEVTTFKKKHTGNNAKFEMMYSTKEVDWKLETKRIKSFKTKKEADDLAMKLSVDNCGNKYITEKEYVPNGSTITTEIVSEMKIYKSRPKLKAMNNRIIVQVHKFMFFGWAGY